MERAEFFVEQKPFVPFIGKSHHAVNDFSSDSNASILERWRENNAHRSADRVSNFASKFTRSVETLIKDPSATNKQMVMDTFGNFSSEMINAKSGVGIYGLLSKDADKLYNAARDDLIETSRASLDKVHNSVSDIEYGFNVEEFALAAQARIKAFHDFFYEIAQKIEERINNNNNEERDDDLHNKNVLKN